MTIDTISLNAIVNDTFPFAAVYPALYQKNLSQAKEQVLAIAHIELSNAKREGIMVLSNKRILMYLIDDNFWKKKRKSLVKMGIDELKGQIIGSIPVVSDIEALYSKVKEKYDQGKAMQGPNEEELDVKVREEMTRLTDILLMEESVYLENLEGWEEKINLTWAEAAESIIELNMIHDSIIMEWKSTDNKYVPIGLIMRKPKLKDAFVMPVFHAIMLHFEESIKEQNLYLVKEEKGTLSIKQSPGNQDFESFIVEDIIHLLKPEEPLPDGYEQPWNLKGKNVKTTTSGVNAKANALQKFNELFYTNLTYRTVEKKLFGKKFNDYQVRPQFIAEFDEIEKSLQAHIFEILKGEGIQVNEVWIACDSNIIEPYKNGFFFTDKGFVYKNRTKKAVLLPYTDLDETTIDHLFGNSYDDKTVDRWMRHYEKSEDGILIDGQTYPYYLDEAYKALLLAICYQTQGVKKEFANFNELSNRNSEPFKIIANQDWCKTVSKVFQTQVQSELLAMYLVQIEPSNEKDTTWVWLFIGKMPNTYLNADLITDQKVAIGVYLRELEKRISGGKAQEVDSSFIPIIKKSEIETKALSEIIDFYKKHVFPQTISF